MVYLRLPGFKRAAVLNRLAQLLMQHSDRFCELESISMGVPAATYKPFTQLAALWLTCKFPLTLSFRLH